MTKQAIMPKQTIANVVAARDRALALYTQASELIAEANEAARMASLSTGHSFTIARHTLGSLGRPLFIEEMQKELDAYVWRNLILSSSLGDLFTVKTRREFNNQLDDAPPEVTVESVTATALRLSADSGRMFTESVQALFQELRPRYKSHDGFSFGDRCIFENMMDYGWLGERGEQTITDFERIVYMLDSQRPPERYGGLIGAIKEARESFQPGEASTEYMRARWYKNGNLHVWLVRDDITQKMNQLLADGTALGNSG